ncbi:MAG: TRC40/GET3/ArsA family transport-energizing ATPase [Candidatus Lokiarchaeota archaeon]|nr:TRC40/GET3/ArsA family transport-energizing ATPase [Candidatus Lokiarchaeota archaeon]
MEKIIVLGGKGGVGKSTISAATAVVLSDLLPEKKILLISFDIAHNLTDLFNSEIGNKLTLITDNLWAIEPDPHKYAEKYTKNLILKMKALMREMPLVGLIPQVETFMDSTFTADSIPLALKNAMFFQEILDAENQQSHQFDIIIADFPPTGNMVALFEIPEDQVKVVLKYSLNFYNSIKDAVRKFSKVFRNIIKPFDDREKRRELGKEILKMLVNLEERGERITELIHTFGSLRLVTIAEKPSFEEIKRARDLTEKYINLEGVHINLITPESQNCQYCNNIRSTQLTYVEEIRKEFKKLKIWESNRLEKEPFGLNGLKSLAYEVYGKSIKAEDILNP